MRRVLTVAAAMLAMPAGATAQVLSCAVPETVPQPRPDRADKVRRLPIGGYTLALSWSPEYCRGQGDRPNARFQCGEGNRFGFVLHGLWPDGTGKQWPQYCRPTGLVPRPLIRRTLCATPSVQLIQHEWAKHGTCMPGYTPQRYFARSTAMYRRLRFPDMEALARRPVTAGTLARAITRANPGVGADMMRITATRQGWLEEVWLCADTSFRYRRCPAHQGGASPDTRLRIRYGNHSTH